MQPNARPATRPKHQLQHHRRPARTEAEALTAAQPDAPLRLGAKLSPEPSPIEGRRQDPPQRRCYGADHHRDHGAKLLRRQLLLRHADATAPAPMVFAAVGQSPMRAPRRTASATRVFPTELCRRGPLFTVTVHDAAVPANVMQPLVKGRSVVGYEQVNHFVQQRRIHFVGKLAVVVGRETYKFSLRITPTGGARHTAAPLNRNFVDGRQLFVKKLASELLVAVGQDRF